MNKRRELQAEWLEIWRLAGSPRLDTQPFNMPDAPLKVRCISPSWESANFGKRFINIQLGEQDVTSLFSLLGGYKGRGCTLYSRHDYSKGCKVDAIMRRGCDYGPVSFFLSVISQAIELHAAAAKAHLDVEAYRATGLPADEIEAKLIAKALRRTRKSRKFKAL